MAELEIGAAVGLEIDTDANSDEVGKHLNGAQRPHRDIDTDPSTGGRYRRDVATAHPVQCTGDKAIAQNNPTRSGLYIDNNSNNEVYVLFGGTDGGEAGCSAMNYTFRLAVGAQYEMPMARDEQGTQRALWTGPIRACPVAGTSVLMVTDITELTN